MRVEDNYKIPNGSVRMILHKGGNFNINTGKIENGYIISEKEIKNLIVNEASTFMAVRMSPGKQAGSNKGDIYSPGNTDGEYESQGLKFLAVGTGPCEKDDQAYNKLKNPLKSVSSGGWDLQNPPEETLETQKLVGELYRKKFTDWKFLDAFGNLSEKPTNVILLSTTFMEGEAAGPLVEMGLFGGDSATVERNTGHMFNYKTFAVWNKPEDARLTITWKLTF